MQKVIHSLKLRISRHLSHTSSFQIILVSVIGHSLLSIFLIYFHLNWYMDYQLSDFQPSGGLKGKQGGVQLARKRLELNLVTSTVLEADSLEQQFNLRGWWSDHSKWNQEFSCFPQKWLLCTKVFSSKCKPDVIRSIYQYIPIKNKVILQNIELALRARTENFQQADGSVSHFGLYAIIELNDGSSNVVKITFPSDSETWMRRSVKFSSKAGTHILSITLMLSCIGYTGFVSFTDIEVIPDLETTQFNSAKQIVANCPRELASASLSPFIPVEASVTSTQTPTLSNEWTIIPLEEPSDTFKRVQVNKITLGTHVSLDRLAILEKNLHTWTGPVSLVVFVPVKDIKSGLEDWQRVYIEKKIKSLNLTYESSVSLVLAQESIQDSPGTKFDGSFDLNKKVPFKYPINKLRNLVISNTFTKYILLVDADFAPSGNIERIFHQTISSMNQQHHTELQHQPQQIKQIKQEKCNSKCAFIVPAFEWLHPDQPLPVIQSKKQLISMILKEDPDIQPFQIFEAPQSHQLTNYFKWYFTSQPYFVLGFGDKFEPYFIAEKNSLPKFNEAFEGYGMNKVTHVIELFASKFKFLVLPDGWLIHMPHKTSLNSIEFLQSPIERVKNRFLRFKFTQSLDLKYNVTRNNRCN